MGIYNYLRDFQLYRKTKNESQSKVVTRPAYMGVPVEQADSGDLTKTDLGSTFVLEPLIQKGIWKKNKDLFGGGWHVVHKDPEKEPDENIITILEEFDTKVNIKDKFILGGVSGDVYGDGFIEKIYGESLTNTSDMPVENYPLVNLKILDGEFIDRTEKKPKSTDNIEYYVLQQKKGLSKQYFHPSRIEHIAERRYPGKKFGISRIYIGRNILNSKIIADREFGTFIEWAGSGVFDNTVTGANENVIIELQKRYASRHKINLHDETESWQVLNPVIFNPQPFADYFYINIAALVDMPWYVLAGVSPGQVTGSEMGIADYYKTLMNLQETIYTPILERIYSEVLRGSNKSFDEYRVEWNPIYIDEMSEAIILKTNAESAVLLYNANSADEEEVRLIARNGIMDKDGNCVLKKELPTIDNKPSIIIQPGETPEEPVPPAPKKEEGWMTAEEKILFEKEKLKGKIEELAQDERLKDAFKNKNKK